MNNLTIVYIIAFIFFIVFILAKNHNKKQALYFYRPILEQDSVSLIWAIAIAAILSRLVFNFIGYVGGTNADFSKGFISTFYDIYVKSGDAPRYINIAQNWYASSGDDAKNIVFYPLYPFFVKIVHYIFVDYFWSGVIISNACFAGACVYLYKLARLDFDDIDSKTAVLFMMLFPGLK